MVNVGLLTVRSVGEFGASQQISTGFASWLRYCTDVAQRRSTKLCTCLALSCLVYYTHLSGSYPLTEFCQVQNSLRPCVLLAYIGSVTARHSSSGRQPTFAAFSTGRHLYSAGRRSRWASANMLVLALIQSSLSISLLPPCHSLPFTLYFSSTSPLSLLPFPLPFIYIITQIPSSSCPETHTVKRIRIGSAVILSGSDTVLLSPVVFTHFLY